MVGSVKIPRRIGAVKISKKVRKKAKKAIKTAASPLVRDFATAAMAAAGRARGASGASGNGGGERVRFETKVHVDGTKVVEAFRTAAVDGIRRFLEGLEEGLREAGAWTDAKPAAAAAAPAKPAKPAKPKAAAKPKAPKAAKPRTRKAAPSGSKSRRAPGP